MVRGSKKETLPVEHLESQLQRSLRRVEPDPRFVGHLQDRLSAPALLVIERRQNTAVGMLVLAVSLLGGFALIWLLRQGRRDGVVSDGVVSDGADSIGTNSGGRGQAGLGKPEFAL